MTELDELAHHSSQGKAVSVKGIHLGDAATALDGLSFKTIEPSFEGQMRRVSGRRYWTPPASTEEVELSDSDILEMIVHQGMDGNLRSDDCMFRVEGGQVQKIFLFDPLCARWGLDSEEAVEEVFGPPAGVQRSYGTAKFHYPARDIQVLYRPQQHSVTIVLGNDPWKPPVFTAQSLLRAYLDLIDVLPVDGAVEFHGSRATKVRYERLCALLRVFGINDHEAMASGKWLESAEPNHLKGLDALWATVKLQRPAKPRLEAHYWAYASLLRYRCGLERLFQHNKGWLECGDGSLRAMIELTEDTNKAFAADAARIDAVLCAFLDPLDQTHSLQTLVDSGYADVDLAQIEMDEL